MIPNPITLAFAMPSASAGVDWLYQFTNNLTNLTTQNGGALTQFGMWELSCVAFFVFFNMVVQWSLSSLSFSFHRQPLRIDDLIRFLLRLILCCLLEAYWVNPLPGADFGLNHFFSYIAQAIVAVLDQNSLNSLLDMIKTVTNGTNTPSLIAPLQLFCYIIVQLLLGLAGAILFLINASSFIFYGVSALFGPIFIPLLMTQTFRGKFLAFLDVLLSFAMMRAVAAAFIFVWAGFLNGFVTQTFNGDYSLAMWLANLVPVITVFGAFIFNMLYIPRLTQALFGGAAGMADGFGRTVTALVSSV
jgi:hypothetical protein